MLVFLSNRRKPRCIIILSDQLFIRNVNLVLTDAVIIINAIWSRPGGTGPASRPGGTGTPSRNERDGTAHPEERDGSRVPAETEGSRVPAGTDGSRVPAGTDGKRVPRAGRDGRLPSLLDPIGIGSNELLKMMSLISNISDAESNEDGSDICDIGSNEIESDVTIYRIQRCWIRYQ